MKTSTNTLCRPKYVYRFSGLYDVENKMDANTGCPQRWTAGPQSKEFLVRTAEETYGAGDPAQRIILTASLSTPLLPPTSG
jgi:hypothetical protein